MVMIEPQPTQSQFQYSLRSLLILATVVAVVCSMIASAGWRVPVLIVVGALICLIGFRPLSQLKHPGVGWVLVSLGFLVRLLGLVIIATGVVLWVTGAGGGR
jgi:hypothetical protein